MGAKYEFANMSSLKFVIFESVKFVDVTSQNLLYVMFHCRFNGKCAKKEYLYEVVSEEGKRAVYSYSKALCLYAHVIHTPSKLPLHEPRTIAWKYILSYIVVGYRTFIYA